VDAISQLRMYRVTEGALDRFVSEWRSLVVPLRRKLGFRVDGAWVLPEESRFVWVVTYEGDGTFQEADAAYYRSPERKAMDPDPARLIEEARTWLMRATPADL